MDEYITRNNAISAVCFGCNQEFSDEPCEPDACAIRQSIMALPTADVVPKSEVERLQIEIKALKIANEKMYSAIEETKAEVVKEIISIIERRIEQNNDRACGVHNEIVLSVYSGRNDGYQDIKEIIEQNYGGKDE